MEWVFRLLVRVLQRYRAIVCVCVYISSYLSIHLSINFSSYLSIIYQEINFKEAIIGAGKSAIAGQAGRLAIQVRVDTAVLSLKSSGQLSRLEFQAEFPLWS